MRRKAYFLHINCHFLHNNAHFFGRNNFSKFSYFSIIFTEIAPKRHFCELKDVINLFSTHKCEEKPISYTLIAISYTIMPISSEEITINVAEMICNCTEKAENIADFRSSF